MNKGLYTSGAVAIAVLLLSLGVFFWRSSQPSDTSDNSLGIPDERMTAYRQDWEDLHRKSGNADVIQKMDPKEEEQRFLAYVQRMEEHQKQMKEIEDTKKKIDDLQLFITDTLREQEPNLKAALEWEKNRPQRLKEQERRRQEMAEIEEEWQALKPDIYKSLSRFVYLDEDLNFLGWRPEFLALRDGLPTTPAATEALPEAFSESSHSAPEEPATEAAPPMEENTIALETDNPIDMSIPIQARVQEWHDALYKDYFDVIVVQELTQEEMNTFFPTPEAQRYLQTQQAELQTELAARAERLLSEDTENREEKLSIIRQTLSENWSPDIADGVLERLK